MLICTYYVLEASCSLSKKNGRFNWHIAVTITNLTKSYSSPHSHLNTRYILEYINLSDDHVRRHQAAQERLGGMGQDEMWAEKRIGDSTTKRGNETVHTWFMLHTSIPVHPHAHPTVAQLIPQSSLTKLKQWHRDLIWHSPLMSLYTTIRRTNWQQHTLNQWSCRSWHSVWTVQEDRRTIWLTWNTNLNRNIDDVGVWHVVMRSSGLVRKGWCDIYFSKTRHILTF